MKAIRCFANVQSALLTRRYPLLTIPAQTALWELLSDAYRAEGLSLKLAFESNNFMTIVAMLRAGFGLAFLTAPSPATKSRIQNPGFDLRDRDQRALCELLNPYLHVLI